MVEILEALGWYMGNKPDSRSMEVCPYYSPVVQKGDKTDVSNYRGNLTRQFHAKYYRKLFSPD